MIDKRDKLRKARKPHRCTLCGERIEAGEHYYYTRVTPWDHRDNDGFSNYRAHEECHDFWHGDYGPDCDWEFPYEGLEGEFRQALQEWQAEEFRLWLVQP